MIFPKAFLIHCWLIALSAPVVFAQLPLVTNGTIQRLENFPSRFVSARNVDVWLPAGYNPAKKYAVLYMHDGQMLFDSTATWNGQEWGVDETLGQLIREKRIRPCIVVGVWNAGKERHVDYFPQKPFESLPKSYRDSLIRMAQRQEGAAIFSGEVQSDGYLKFLVTELKPFIDSVYSTRKDRAHTFIAGSSMGGLISMYAICEYPGVFGGAACLSTHWPGIFSVEGNPIPAAFLDYLKSHLPSPKSHKLYFDYGTETLDALYEPFQQQADEIIKRKGFSRKNWMSRKFAGADHSEQAWRNRLDIPITFLLGK